MARCGFATWNPKGTTPGPKIDPRVVIFHVTAGLGNAQPHSGLEWHFEVSLSGALEQQVDTNLRADANYKANPFAISIETEGKGEGSWTDAQLDTLVRLSHWCIDVHPKIRAQRCNAWDGSGFGYHVMWGAPGMWTPVAKSCPGPKRIAQFDSVLLPRILSPIPVPPEDDMPTAAEVAAATLDLFNREMQNVTGIPAAHGLAVLLGRIDQNAALGAASSGGVSAADIAAAIPDGLAQAVADELAERLKQ
jgi:hypothetical protein